MVQLALAGEFVPFAVNLAVAEAHESLRPFLPLAERLGGLFGSLVGADGRCPGVRLPPTIEMCVEGDIGAHDTRIVGLAVLKGLFARVVRRSGHVRQRSAAGEGARHRRSARCRRRRRRTTST